MQTQHTWLPEYPSAICPQAGLRSPQTVFSKNDQCKPSTRETVHGLTHSNKQQNIMRPATDGISGFEARSFDESDSERKRQRHRVTKPSGHLEHHSLWHHVLQHEQDLCCIFTLLHVCEQPLPCVLHCVSLGRAVNPAAVTAK